MEPSEPSNDDLAAYLDRLFQPFARSDSPGLIVAVSSRWDFLYRRGLGLASLQHAVANLPQTRIRFASITKQFTSLALMLLAEQGDVDIDAPVSAYIPGLHAPLGAATLRQFMTHSSGYRCTLELGSIANGFAPQPPGWQRRVLCRQEDVQFPPGEGQLYCNGTYAALTDVIERCSGQGFADFMKQRIFEPLAMHDTDIVGNDTIMVPGMAAPHIRNGQGWRRPPADTETHGDGGIVSTVDDMLRWLAHLRGPGPKIVGSEKTWGVLLEPLMLGNGFRTTYAMGFKCHSYRGVEVIQHSGGLFGLNAQVISVPEHAVDIVIAVNGAPVSATRLAFSALDACLGKALSKPALQRPRAAAFDYLLGRGFADPSGLFLSFADVEGKLGLSQMHMTPAPILYEDGQTIFALFEEIGFGPLVWQKADLARWRHNPDGTLPVAIAGTTHQLEPLTPPDASCADILGDAAGRYHSRELAADLLIRVGGGNATIAIKGDYAPERLFEPSVLSERHFGIVSHDGDERYSIELDLDAGGKPCGIRIDTHRARRVRFARVEGQQP